MLKKGKKILAALLALALSASLFAACGKDFTSEPLPGDTAGEVVSNGGFVVEKGNYIYFINGVEEYTADNTYGTPVKGSLMRIAKSDLDAGDYGAAETVVPVLFVSQDLTSGFYIYGDRVYYATPTTARNPDGDIENSYIDFKSSALDGSSTMGGYYVRMSDNATVFRYVADEDGNVYLLYVDSANARIRSYNTQTGDDTVLVAGYQDYVLNTDDLTDPEVYYTMSVVRNYGYSESAPSSEPYQQVYKVSAFQTESPYEMDLSADYTDKETGEVLEYVNLGTLVLDGIGRKNQPTPFNHDIEGGDTSVSYYAGSEGVTYTLLKYSNGGLYYTNSELSSSSFLYYLPAEGLDAALEGGTWNSVTGNANNLPGAQGDINVRIAIGTEKAGEAALFFEREGEQYYIYADGTSIVRVRADGAAASFVGERVTVARGLSSTDGSSATVTLLYIDGDFLYFTLGDGGIYRINCMGSRNDYNNLGKTQEYKATRYLDLAYDSSWYVPEIAGGFLFFANAGDYAENYVFAMPNPATNEALQAINDKYEDVQEVLDEISGTYADAGSAAQYYYYTGDAEILADEAYAESYSDEEKAVFEAFVGCIEYKDSYGVSAFDASVLTDGTAKWNVRSYFFGALGKMSDEDAESIADNLKGDLLIEKDA